MSSRDWSSDVCSSDLVAAAQASVEGLAARVAQQETAIRQAQAAVAVDDAELKLAEANQKRYRNLAADGSGSIQAQQQAEAQLAIRLASRDKNRAGLQAARQQTDILKADPEKRSEEHTSELQSLKRN